MSTRTFRTAVGAATLALVTAGLGWLGAATAGATGGPHIVVTPRTNLHNKEVLHVSGTGFKPGETVYIVECLRTASGAAGCNTLNLVMESVGSDGSFPSSRFVVSTGKIGTGTCGTTKANLSRCDVSVGNQSGTDSATAPIVFALKKK